MRNIATLLITLLTITSASTGNTLLVPSEYPTIQSAIDAADDGDEVVIAPGIYTGPGNRDITYHGKAITVRSTDPNDPNIVATTVIDCNADELNPHNGFMFVKGEGLDSVLSGLTIKNGFAPREPSPWFGAGDAVFCSGASPRIEKCAMPVSRRAFAVICCSASTSSISDCHIEGLVSTYTTGIYLEGGNVRIARCVMKGLARSVFCLDANAVVSECKMPTNGAAVSCYGDCNVTIDKCEIYQTLGVEESIVRVRGGKISIFDSTIAGSAGSCAVVFEGRELVARNCTISDNRRGGIQVFSSDRVELVGCEIKDNRSDVSSGGVRIGGTAYVVLTDCTIRNNTSRWEGAGVYIECTHAELKNCIISENSATKTGGGIFVARGDVVLLGCEINSNSSTYNGGGVFCNQGQLLVKQCRILKNSAGGKYSRMGGGICGNRVTIERSYIGSNQSSRGGGAYLSMRGVIRDSVIAENIATEKGGGLFLSAGDERINITNCTIAGNSAKKFEGGGIVAYGADITNCVLWGNDAPGLLKEQQIAGNLIDVRYSCIKGGRQGEGNIDADPHFAFDADFHIMGDSPCIDAGTNDPCGGLSTNDFDGNFRSIDGDGNVNARADMGAYEFNPSAPSLAVGPQDITLVSREGEPKIQSFGIRNCGGGKLEWTITGGCEWLIAEPQSGISTGENDLVELSFMEANLPGPGRYECKMEVNGTCTVNGPIGVNIVLYVSRLLGVPSDYNTIQSAIDDANEYDMVLVSDGIYTGTGNRDLDFKGKSIIVCSSNGPENCIIDCNGEPNQPHRGFYFHNSEKNRSIVQGFTITNGCAWSGQMDFGGGGIRCDMASPTIRDCIIRDCHTSSDRGIGGGILCYYSETKIVGCVIVAN